MSQEENVETVPVTVTGKADSASQAAPESTTDVDIKKSKKADAKEPGVDASKLVPAPIPTSSPWKAVSQTGESVNASEVSLEEEIENTRKQKERKNGGSANTMKPTGSNVKWVPMKASITVSSGNGGSKRSGRRSGNKGKDTKKTGNSNSTSDSQGTNATSSSSQSKKKNTKQAKSNNVKNNNKKKDDENNTSSTDTDKDNTKSSEVKTKSDVKSSSETVNGGSSHAHHHHHGNNHNHNHSHSQHNHQHHHGHKHEQNKQKDVNTKDINEEKETASVQETESKTPTGQRASSGSGQKENYSTENTNEQNAGEPSSKHVRRHSYHHQQGGSYGHTGRQFNNHHSTNYSYNTSNANFHDKTQRNGYYPRQNQKPYVPHNRNFNNNMHYVPYVQNSYNAQYYNTMHALITAVQNVSKQIEYYFSEENLSRDSFLKSKFSDAGFVPIDLIAKFFRVVNMSFGGDPTIILAALREIAANEDSVVEVVRGKSNAEEHEAKGQDNFYGPEYNINNYFVRAKNWEKWLNETNQDSFAVAIEKTLAGTDLDQFTINSSLLPAQPYMYGRSYRPNGYKRGQSYSRGGKQRYNSNSSPDNHRSQVGDGANEENDDPVNDNSTPVDIKSAEKSENDEQ